MTVKKYISEFISVNELTFQDRMLVMSGRISYLHITGQWKHLLIDQ